MQATILYQPKHQKKKKRNLRPIAAIAIAVAVLGVLLWVLTHGGAKEDANISYIGEIPVVRSYLPEGSASRPGIKRDIKFVVIHETDNFSAGAGAKAHNAFLLTNADTQELSWHYTVDDHEIYHNLPDDEAAYHASDHLEKNGGNLNGIGVELCVNEDGDYERTLENGAQLTATLLYEYGLKLRDVKRHQDFSGKECPARLIHEGLWDAFLDRVQTEYDALKAQEKED